MKITKIANTKTAEIGDGAHLALDLAGLIPGYGEIFDLANAVAYISEGRYFFAALSIISCIPTLGDIVGKGGKLAAWVTKTVPKGAKVIEYTAKAGKAVKYLKISIQQNRSKIDEVIAAASEKSEKIAQAAPQLKEALDAFASSPTQIQEEEMQQAAQSEGEITMAGKQKGFDTTEKTEETQTIRTRDMIGKRKMGPEELQNYLRMKQKRELTKKERSKNRKGKQQQNERKRLRDMY
jgi:hypothetical protein